ncbi:hypothetical protein B0H15DRAFT_957420 [Mycena belliarum]|uniref:Uncharacterized protein n=1 Tax=Mycena belliarum TaxID=1033014 RepID=A0AAD6XII0_9AGAR|nr:hypothetical protein B0H15DRAFT_957420 [Mycena belliae]
MLATVPAPANATASSCTPLLPLIPVFALPPANDFLNAALHHPQRTRLDCADLVAKGEILRDLRAISDMDRLLDERSYLLCSAQYVSHRSPASDAPPCTPYSMQM